MRDTADLGAVMWPVVYPNMGEGNNPRDPHITVVIFTDISNPELGFTKEDVIDAVRTLTWDVYLWTRVTGLEWFGENQDVPVLRVEHDYLLPFHDAIVKELSARGIPVDNTFPDYKPHVTIPDTAALDGIYPKKLLAGPVQVWWGDEKFDIVENIIVNKVGL
jgi:hypothetical protein